MWLNRQLKHFAGLMFLLILGLSLTVHAQETMLATAYTNEGIPALIGPDGMTLYTFANDDEGESTCYDRCAEEWMPFILDEGSTLAAADGVPGQTGTVAREDGSHQVTYNGSPLYYYHEDQAPGEANGHGSDDIWFVANPATVMLNSAGTFLVGPGGMTLYIFTEDEDSETYCFEECTVAWFPLVVLEGMQPLAGANVPGTLSLIERPEGLMQVAYNGMPLYFFKGDRVPGDTIGHGIKDVWFILSPQGTFQEPGGSVDTAPAATEEVPVTTVDAPAPADATATTGAAPAASETPAAASSETATTTATTTATATLTETATATATETATLTETATVTATSTP